MQGMTSLLAQRGGRIRVHLEPVQLGPVTIDVEVKGDHVRAVIETATRAAQRVLEAATSRIRAALEAQGYTLDRLDVRHDGQASSESPDQPDDGDRREDAGEDGRRPRYRSPVLTEQNADEPFTLEDLNGQEKTS